MMDTQGAAEFYTEVRIVFVTFVSVKHIYTASLTCCIIVSLLVS